jgi:hypothetical protein
MHPRTSSITLTLGLLAALALAWPAAGWPQAADSGRGAAAPTITITEVPPPGGGPGRMELIAGRASATDVARYRVVIFSYTDRWYVQPFVSSPFTEVKADGTWSSRIHLGTEYAAVLVDGTYKPPATTFELPKPGRGVVAVIRAPAR